MLSTEEANALLQTFLQQHQTASEGTRLQRFEELLRDYTQLRAQRSELGVNKPGGATNDPVDRH